MIDKEFIIEKVNLISRDLKRLEVFSDFSLDEVAKDFMKMSSLKNIFMEIIGRAIDINEHLISELAEPETEIPKSYRETFLLLGEFGILPKDFAGEISKSAGFRNAIVHEYNNLNKQFVFEKVGMAIDQYKKYCDFILKFLEK